MSKRGLFSIAFEECGMQQNGSFHATWWDWIVELHFLKSTKKSKNQQNPINKIETVEKSANKNDNTTPTRIVLSNDSLTRIYPNFFTSRKTNQHDKTILMKRRPAREHVSNFNQSTKHGRGEGLENLLIESYWISINQWATFWVLISGSPLTNNFHHSIWSSERETTET